METTTPSLLYTKGPSERGRFLVFKDDVGKGSASPCVCGNGYSSGRSQTVSSDLPPESGRDVPVGMSGRRNDLWWKGSVGEGAIPKLSASESYPGESSPPLSAERAIRGAELMAYLEYSATSWSVGSFGYRKEPICIAAWFGSP